MSKLFSFHLVELKINTLIFDKIKCKINNLLIIPIELNKDYIDTSRKLLEKIDIRIKISVESSRLNINVL